MIKNFMFICLLVVFFTKTSFSAYNSDNFSNDFHNYLLKDLEKHKAQDASPIILGDLSEYLTDVDPLSVYGFIGFELERIKTMIRSIHFDKDSARYKIIGKTNVSGTKSDFVGYLNVISHYQITEPITSHGLLIVMFDAEFIESGNSAHSGIFKGFYYLILSDIAGRIEKAKAIPHFLANNTFVGRWTSKSGKMNFPVLWGEDYIFEDLESLFYKITGQATIDESIINKSWNTYFDATTLGVKQSIKEAALRYENNKWWND
ncbi:MAG: hypothetical protein WC313_10370 [Candidatus Kapaibacterium sp.]|nr:hypothetical protein [Candidatus Kapabacteria bacterium]